MRTLKRLSILIVIVLLAGIGTAVPEEYVTLQKGVSGPGVLRLKQAMYYLGYFTSLNLSDGYNDVMVQRVKMLQKNNGLEEDGIATPELQALVYSGNCIPAPNAPAPTPLPTEPPAPLSPEGLPQDMPECDEKGLLKGDGEYIYIDADTGLWIYKSAVLSVVIKRFIAQTDRLVWFELDIVCTPECPMKTYLSPGRIPGKAYKSPVALSKDNNVILGITDDFFGHRLNNNKRTGIVVRQGAVIGNQTIASDREGFPNLEVLAQFVDGSLKCYRSAEYTAQEYIDMGAVNTFAFGPILISDGQIDQRVFSKNYYHYREPRCALGMIEPYHYAAVIVKGRVNDSRGIYMDWLAERLYALGAVEALNLDGGGTVALVFMGQILNKTTKNMRNVTSIIGFGQTTGEPGKE
ncbi:MAG: phosphodiester glycosidase family protein [Clostridia bacterium]|nr:phosphodiester glycosidase family protein [Clostridia bacterium]